MSVVNNLNDDDITSLDPAAAGRMHLLYAQALDDIARDPTTLSGLELLYAWLEEDE